jgi:hypothetical protein
MMIMTFLFDKPGQPADLKCRKVLVTIVVEKSCRRFDDCRQMEWWRNWYTPLEQSFKAKKMLSRRHAGSNPAPSTR